MLRDGSAFVSCQADREAALLAGSFLNGADFCDAQESVAIQVGRGGDSGEREKTGNDTDGQSKRFVVGSLHIPDVVCTECRSR